MHLLVMFYLCIHYPSMIDQACQPPLMSGWSSNIFVLLTWPIVCYCEKYTRKEKQERLYFIIFLIATLTTNVFGRHANFIILIIYSLKRCTCLYQFKTFNYQTDALQYYPLSFNLLWCSCSGLNCLQKLSSQGRISNLVVNALGHFGSYVLFSFSKKTKGLCCPEFLRSDLNY